MQFNWNNKYQQFLSIHVRYPSPYDPTLKTIDLLQKNFLPREGKQFIFHKFHKLPTIPKYSNEICEPEINFL